jgi:hypothetical protein
VFENGDVTVEKYRDVRLPRPWSRENEAAYVDRALGFLTKPYASA